MYSQPLLLFQQLSNPPPLLSITIARRFRASDWMIVYCVGIVIVPITAPDM